MPDTATQANRLLVLDTPLGKDKLLIHHLSGRDGISQLFRYQLQMLSNDKNIDAKQIVGKPISVSLQLDKGNRYFHGHVSRFSVGQTDYRYTQYEAEVVPWLWFLTQTSDLRIFQDKTIPDVIEKIFKEYGFKDYRLSLTGKYTSRDYIVQYRETDFNFVTRLMEQEGIFYYFEHEKSKHTLVLSDSLGQGKPVVGVAKPRYWPEGGAGEIPEDTVRSWQQTTSYTPGKYTYRDYHFEKPDSTLQVERPTGQSIADNSKYEMYDFPGEYTHQIFNKPSARLGDIQTEGQKQVGWRMPESDAPQKTAQGTSDLRGFNSGQSFELDKHPALNGKYVLTGVDHSASQSPDYYTESTVEQPYQNNFTALPAATSFHPARTTPKPVVQGLQTAVVVGAKGKEIDVDKFARIKVQFHWDREGKKDENSSCWMRVAQQWAGKRWGASFWPRIGQEVVVAFIEGDPDQPIVIGSVYNAEQMPPYIGQGLDPKHPHEPNITGVKSNSTLGGKGYNEWRFDDTKDKEQIFVHAEKNKDERVDHDSMELVGKDRHLIVGPGGKKGEKGSQFELIHVDKHLNVKKDHIEKIEGDQKFTVGKGEGKGGNQDIVIEKDKKELIEQNSDLHIKKDLKELVDGNVSLHVKKDQKEKIDGSVSLQVGKDQNEKVGQNYAIEAGQVIHVKSGMTIVIEAGTQLSLKVGGNFIDINPAGVFIQGTMVMINSGGAAGSGPGAKPDAPDDAEDAKEAKPTKPTEADKSVSGSKSAPG